jgi:AcrR family transcriptional regulator
MRKPAKRRRYDSSARRAAAQMTRHSILECARRLFLAKGYAAATMPAIARAADVALDTVYAAVGTKAALFRVLVEAALSGHDEAIPADEREYVRAIRAELDAARKLRIYASALVEIQPRLAPLFQVLQAAAPLEPDLKALWLEISRRRAANMRLLAENLAATGRVRADLSVTMVADILWSTNSPEFYLLLVDQRAWSAEAFGLWLGDAWIRLLLKP